MPLSSKLFFDCEVTTSGKDDTPKSASKTNPKGVTTNFTTSSGKGGTSKGFTSSISNVRLVFLDMNLTLRADMTSLARTQEPMVQHGGLPSVGRTTLTTATSTYWMVAPMEITCAL